jgi:hypothetical protein
MAPKAKAKASSASKRAEEPSLGLLRPRLLASVFLYTVTAAVLYKMADDSGMTTILKSHLRAAPWNPLSKPCGLLEAKEYVILSDRIVVGKGQASGPQPGAGKRGKAGVPAATAPPSLLLPDQWLLSLGLSWHGASVLLRMLLAAHCTLTHR